MAHFYGGIQGNRGEATRLGTKSSGLNGFLNGWNIGINVNLNYDEEEDTDIVSVYLTHGSTHGNRSDGLSKHIGTFTIKDLE